MINVEKKELNFIEVVPNTVNNIFILLHGFGSDNQDLMSLGENFRDLLPNTALISVNAPSISDAGTGYQWFSFKSMNLFTILKEIRISYTLLNSFIDEQLKRFNLTDENLIIGGFSQGAMMSLYTGLRRKSNPLAVLAFSGMMPDTIATLQKELTSKPEVLLIHGTEDKTVPFNSMEKAEYLLREFNISFEAHAIHNMGHEVNEEAINYAREFIKMVCNKIY